MDISQAVLAIVFASFPSIAHGVGRE